MARNVGEQTDNFALDCYIYPPKNLSVADNSRPVQDLISLIKVLPSLLFDFTPLLIKELQVFGHCLVDFARFLIQVDDYII